MEQWKPVSGYEGLYEVSDRGRVRSVEKVVTGSSRNGGLTHRMPRLLRQNQKRNGYLTVDLCRQGTVRTTLVHRIVAQAFLSNPDNLSQVNHLNLTKTDNRAENLEWCSPLENMRHAQRNGARGTSSLRRFIRCRETGAVFAGSYKAAEWVNSERGHTGDVPCMARSIRAAATGRTKSSYGFHWEDVIEEPSTTIPKGSTPKRAEMAVSV